MFFAGLCHVILARLLYRKKYLWNKNYEGIFMAIEFFTMENDFDRILHLSVVKVGLVLTLCIDAFFYVDKKNNFEIIIFFSAIASLSFLCGY